MKKTLLIARYLQRDSGSVLIAVSMLSLVMMLIAVGIITLNSSQALSNRHQIERIKADQVAQGVFWQNYMSLMTTNSITVLNQEILDNKKYTPTMSVSSGGPNGTTAYTITVDYSTP